jgi:hypothetical protein
MRNEDEMNPDLTDYMEAIAAGPTTWAEAQRELEGRIDRQRRRDLFFDILNVARTMRRPTAGPYVRTIDCNCAICHPRNVTRVYESLVDSLTTAQELGLITATKRAEMTARIAELAHVYIAPCAICAVSCARQDPDDIPVCNNDWRETTRCDCCDTAMLADDACFLEGADVSVCAECRDNYYLFCHDCDQYYERSDGHDCPEREKNGCDCTPRFMAFQFPRQGAAPLESGKLVKLETPRGAISETGMALIQSYLTRQCPEITGEARYSVNGVLCMTEPTWVIPRGKVAGTFPKRIAKLVWQNLNIRLSAATMARIGDLARTHSESIAEMYLEVSRDFEERDMWVYRGSCWWSDYAEGRCLLKTLGGLGIRGFAQEDSGFPFCRAWILPLEKDPAGGALPTGHLRLRPAADQDPMSAEAFLVFNGYRVNNEGEDYHPEGYTLEMARVVAGLTGMSYHKTRISISYMYVNDNAGYIVAAPELLSEYGDDMRFALSVRGVH